jgi:hypothetical protein
MDRFYAFHFVHLFSTIGQFRQAFSLGVGFLKMQDLDEDTLQLWDENRDGLGMILDSLKRECEKLALPLSMLKLDRIKGTWSSIKAKEMVNQFGHLEEVIQDELASKMFILIPTEREKYCPELVGSKAGKSPLFGEAVQNKFPELTADIVDAGWCLAVGRSTAAVFHLMGVMEAGIRRLARKLKIPKPQMDRRMWGAILGTINASIQTLPYATTREKDRKDQFAEAVAHLGNVKDAWRNPTMHSRRRYTQEEAEAIFGNVKTFINHLATIV